MTRSVFALLLTICAAAPQPRRPSLKGTIRGILRGQTRQPPRSGQVSLRFAF
jgi:hypothetical protein